MSYKRTSKIMKRIFTVSFSVVITLLFVFPFADVSGAENKDELIVGVPADRCPIFYIDEETNEITGIGVDLMKLAAENAGYVPVFRVIEETTLKEALDNEEYDVVIPFGSAVTSSSGKASIVTENLFQTPFTLVTSSDGKLPPLGSLKVGMLKSLAAGAETVKQLYPNIEIKLYDTMDDCVKALRSGEVDALLHNSYVWSYVLQKSSYQNLKVQPSSMFSMDFKAGTLENEKGNTVIERLNSGIEKISDTQRQAIILKYTSRNLYKYDLSDYLFRYGPLYIMGALLLAAIIAIAVQRIRAVKKQQEEQLRNLLDHDPLTGLLSLNGFKKRAVELISSHPDTPYFLSYNNIRDFKFINDSLGREAGDELLKFWAKKSMENIDDDEAIGRITSDRFVVLRHIASDEQMMSDLKNVFEPVKNFFIDRGKENKVQIVSGIYVLTPKDFRNIDIDHMIDFARVAEKRARESRKEDHIFYNPDQWERGKRIADIVNYLPTALKSGDIQVYYQPQVNYETGEIVGAEALCRWDHVKLGWLSPPGFIETLEDAGLIYDLDCFVWERVCQDLQRWNGQGIHRSVSVNVSRDDISDDIDIVEKFIELIKTYDLTPEQLRIEITETAYAEKPELLIETTQKLQSYGFKVEMDDFGSGYSSLHMLKEVPVDCIKLDLNFLTASGDPKKSHTIISCVIQMINLLKLELIAEGVETKEQADFLKSKGDNIMQGFYFYKPMPVEEFEKLKDRVDPSLSDG